VGQFEPNRLSSYPEPLLPCATLHAIGIEHRRVEGRPAEAHISASCVERANLTLRMDSCRFTRLTNALSKKAENHAHSVAIHTMHYNFVRIHQTLVAPRLWPLA